MQKLGEGYYYDVYALSTVQVVKKRTGWLRKVFKLFRWYWHEPIKLARALIHMRSSVRISLASSRELAQIGALRPLLGNPIFLNDDEYEQDRAIPLAAYVGSADPNEFVDLVRQYADCVRLLWEYGRADTVYNFTINAGVSRKTGQVILFDFNELAASKDKVMRDIRERKWLSQYSSRLLRVEHPMIWGQARDVLESILTIDALERCWGRRLS